MTPPTILIAIALAVLFSEVQLIQAQTFDSSSNGSDGALNLTTPGTIEFDPKSFNPPLDTDGDNIYHFTTINIGPGVIVRLTARKINGPVFWLAKNKVQINGTINLNGEDGQSYTDVLNGAPRSSAIPGSGGYPGAIPTDGLTKYAELGPGGGNPSVYSQPYCGNAGGAGHASPGQGPSGPGGKAYGNAFLVPLLAGSGGGGSENGGGAGGGAILIASSEAITLNGTISANGGGLPAIYVCANSNYGNGGGGSGGAVRLVAPRIDGGGTITAFGYQGGAGTRGSEGRIRLETFQHAFTGTTNPLRILATPFALFLLSGLPSVRVVSIDGQAIVTNTGSFTVPDVKINKVTASIVNIAATNIPLGTVVKLHVFSENGADQIIDSTPLAGSSTASTATATITLPPGFSRGFVRAIWTNP